MIGSIIGVLVGVFNIVWSRFHLKQRFDILHYAQYLVGVICVFMNFVVIVGYVLDTVGLISL